MRAGIAKTKRDARGGSAPVILIAKSEAADIKRKRIKRNIIPTMWQLEERLRGRGQIPKGMALSFFCPVYFAGQKIVQKMLNVKDEHGELVVFPLPPITDPGRIKMGLMQMKRLGIKKPERYLKKDHGKSKNQTALLTYSTLPGYEGAGSDHLYGYIAMEAVQLGAFSVVPEEWLNTGDPYNETYRFPGEDGYSPYWRIPTFEEFKKLRPDLASSFKSTKDGIVSKSISNTVLIVKSKVSKDKANYIGVARDAKYACRNCRFFEQVGDNKCTRVVGEIKAKASCDLFEASKKTEKSMSESKTLIIKAGEGSRGGKVIGHTKSGKPIYANASHANIKEAYSHHAKTVQELLASGKKHKDPEVQAALRRASKLKPHYDEGRRKAAVAEQKRTGHGRDPVTAASAHTIRQREERKMAEKKKTEKSMDVTKISETLIKSYMMGDDWHEKYADTPLYKEALRIEEMYQKEMASCADEREKMEKKSKTKHGAIEKKQSALRKERDAVYKDADSIYAKEAGHRSKYIKAKRGLALKYLSHRASMAKATPELGDWIRKSEGAEDAPEELDVLNGFISKAEVENVRNYGLPQIDRNGKYYADPDINYEPERDDPSLKANMTEEDRKKRKKKFEGQQTIPEPSPAWIPQATGKSMSGVTENPASRDAALAILNKSTPDSVRVLPDGSSVPVPREVGFALAPDQHFCGPTPRKVYSPNVMKSLGLSEMNPAGSVHSTVECDFCKSETTSMLSSCQSCGSDIGGPLRSLSGGKASVSKAGFSTSKDVLFK